MKSIFRNSLLAGLLVTATLATPAMAQEKGEDTKLKKAIELIKSTGTLPPYEEQLKLIKRNSKVWLIRQQPAAEKEIAAAVEDVSKVYEDGEAKFVAHTAAVWASYFTEEELSEIIEFFKTPAGQKLANYQPRVIGETIGAVQLYSKVATQEIVEKAKTKLKEKGLKFD